MTGGFSGAPSSALGVAGSESSIYIDGKKGGIRWVGIRDFKEKFKEVVGKFLIEKNGFMT